MDKTRIELIEITKEAMVKEAHAISLANKMVKVSGTRHILPLDGRDIEIVYYSADAKNAPLIIGCHGGGFLFGGCALDDAMWTETVKILGCNVASVGYRMSPDYKWDSCLYDCYDSAVYLKDHAEDFGFDPAHISIMGQSAGGNLAAAVPLFAKSRNEIKFDNQILIYPFLDVYTEPEEKSGKFEPDCYVMNMLHCKHDEAKNPLISPVYSDISMISGLPNTIISVSENDSLRHEGEIYYEMLKKSGVKVNLMVANDMPHAYFEFGFKGDLKNGDYDFLGEDSRELVKSGKLRHESYRTLEFIKENFIK